MTTSNVVSVEKLRIKAGEIDVEYSEFEIPFIETVQFQLSLLDDENTESKIGRVNVQFLNRRVLPPDVRFFEAADEHSHELAQLGLLFNDRGVLKPEAYTVGTGVWTNVDARKLAQKPLAYVEEIVIDEPWRGKGVGSWAISQLWETDVFRSKGSMYLITWPTVLNYLEPPSVNGPFGRSTTEEVQAYENKRSRICDFCHRNGFRRIGTSQYFMLAKDPSNGSRQLPAEQDADFVDVTTSRLPRSEQELMDWILANN